MNFLFLLLSLFFPLSYGSLNIETEDLNKDVTSKVQVLLNNEKKVEDIFELPFKGNGLKEIKIGYQNGQSVFRFRLKAGQSSEKLVLVFNHNLAGSIQVFKKQGKKIAFVGVTGSLVPYYKRLVPGMSVAIPLSFDREQSVEYVLLRDSVHRFDAKVTVMSETDFKQKEANKRGVYFFYFGGFVCLMIYSFFLFLATKEQNYLLYFLFCFFIHLDVISIIGFADFLTKGLGITISQHLIRYSCLASIFAFIFGIKYTQSYHHDYFLVKFLKFLVICCVALFCISIDPWSYFFGRAYLGYIIDVIILSGCTSLIILAIKRSIDGVVEAKFYLFSWFFMFGGVFLYMGHYFGVFTRNAITAHGLMFGNLGEMLIVSFGLAYKINVLDKEKREALLKARGQLLYKRMVRAIIHDLSNPLLLIKHYVKFKVNNPVEFKLKEEKAWEKISLGVSKITEIIEFNKRHESLLNDQKEEFSLERVNLYEVIEEVISIFEERFLEKELRLHNNIDKDTYVLAERTTLIYDVISNIFSNSLKFCEKKGNLWISCEDRMDNILITFQDDGLGMTRDQLQRFNQNGEVNSEKGLQGEEGSGFGLFLIKSYMELYGGTINIYSDNEGGRSGLAIYLKFLK